MSTNVMSAKKHRRTPAIHVGIETGGTSCKVAVVTWDEAQSMMSDIRASCMMDEKPPANGFLDENRVRFKKFQTGDPHATCSAMTDFVARSCKEIQAATDSFEEPALTLGLLSFGPIGLDKTNDRFGWITTTPKIAWRNFPILQTLVWEIAEKTGFQQVASQDFIRSQRVVFDTDCNMLARFEADHGGHGVDDYVGYMTVGTGVGIGLLINGSLLHGAMHPEGGHLSVPDYVPSAQVCRETDWDASFSGVCPLHGKYCVAGNATNESIVKRLKLKSVEDVAKVPDNHPYIWDCVGHYLGHLCASVILINSLKKIVIGGGVVVGRGDVLMAKIRSTMVKALGGYLLDYDERQAQQVIVRSRLGDELGLLSAIFSPKI